ncbi:MAG TPA: EAL domain-containing protein, partial [Acidimicrobiales bacterium]
ELANQDTLTGLANRASLGRHLVRAIGSAAADEYVAVLFIDLDRFKPINDLYGHDAGDRLLIEVADRLREAVPAGSLVARFGGDEFVVVLERVRSRGGALAVMSRIEQYVSRPVHVGRATVPVNASVGIAIADATGTADNVLTEADAAMYAVKVARRGSRQHDLLPEARRWVADELPRAIDERELVVQYQPVVRTSDESVVGFEALVRWEHPVRGTIPPSSFLSVAEDAGLGPALGELVLEDAIDLLGSLRPLGEEYFVSCNLSPSQLHDPVLPRWLRRRLTEAGVQPRSLWVEITESAALDRVGDTMSAATDENMRALKDVGVKIAVDDFGTGYASLIHLRRLPADAIKIDRSFITELATNTADTGIVRSMVVLGQVLGLDIVAEGVVTEEQARAVAALGCQFAQGFRYGRPMPREQTFGCVVAGGRSRTLSMQVLG